MLLSTSSSTLPTVYEGKHLQPCHKFICKTCSCCARPVMTAGFNCPEHPVCRTCLAKSMVSQIDAGKAMCSCPVEGCNVQLPEKVYSCAWLRDVTAKRRSNMQELHLNHGSQERDHNIIIVVSYFGTMIQRC